MTRVLFLSLQVSGASSKGHLNPLVPVAQRLVADQHDVAWLPLPRAMGAADRAQLAQAGVALLDDVPVTSGAKSAAELSALAADPARGWAAYASFLLDPVAELLGPVRDRVTGFAPDVIATDSMSYVGIIAAHQLGIPYVCLCAGLKMTRTEFAGAYTQDLGPLVEPRRELFARYGMAPEFRLLECLSPQANAVFATPELIGAADLPPTVHLVGPSIPDGVRGDEPPFDWDLLAPDKKLVYVAFGSVHSHAPLTAMVREIAEAAARLDLQVVVSSEALADERPTLPGGCLVVRYAPQREILDRAAVFVTHGGANSVMEGTWAGVPLLVVPLSSDQPIQAQLVTERRTGTAIERAELTARRCHDAFALLLEPGGVVQRTVRELRENYRAADGAGAAARLILRHAK